MFTEMTRWAACADWPYAYLCMFYDDNRWILNKWYWC
jgi:hypothetical protein